MSYYERNTCLFQKIQKPQVTKEWKSPQSYQSQERTRAGYVYFGTEL